jgi:Leucine-rich repeat (LRR) protein
MKTILSILAIALFSNLILAQNTVIPDPNFEQALINLGYDIGIPNGTIPTSNIDTVKHLNVTHSYISNLSGIEDFTVLIELDCSNNQLTNINISQNTSLTIFFCERNQLTNIDVSQNTNLTNLACSFNNLTNLNVSQNIALIDLTCGANQLTSLDVSHNPNLTYLYCFNNNLSCLNVRNGNNINFSDFSAQNNPNLNCIEVDNVNWSALTWTIPSLNIDQNMSFSTSCPNSCAVGVNEHKLTNTSLYPNPTTSNFTLDLGEIIQDIKATLTNNLGQLMLTQQFESTSIISIDIDSPPGIYFLQIETFTGETKTIKVLKE